MRAQLERHPLLAAVSYTVLGNLPLYLVSAQLLQLERDLGFGSAQLGLVVSCFFGAAALTSAPVGRIVQRRGATLGLRSAALLNLAALLVIGATTGGWWPIPVAAAVAGMGNSIAQVSSNLVLAEQVAGRRHGISFGVKQAAVPLASMIAGAAVPLVGLAVGWRWAFVSAAALALVLAVSAPVVPHRPRPAASARTGSRRPAAALLALAVGGATAAAGGNPVSLFLVSAGVRSGLSEAGAGVLLSVCSALVIVNRVGVGWLVDRLRSSGHREMALLMGLGALGCLQLAVADGRLAFVAGTVLAMVAGWGWSGLIYYTVVRLAPQSAAGASGAVLAGNFAGAIVGPVIVGVLAERGAYDAAWLLCGALLLIAAVGVLVSKRLSSTPAATSAGV